MPDQKVRVFAQINLRLPPDLKERLMVDAHTAFRSLNAEIVCRLAESYGPSKMEPKQ